MGVAVRFTGGGCGALKRRSPIGAAAKRTFRKVTRDSFCRNLSLEAYDEPPPVEVTRGEAWTYDNVALVLLVAKINNQVIITLLGFCGKN